MERSGWAAWMLAVAGCGPIVNGSASEGASTSDGPDANEGEAESDDGDTFDTSVSGGSGEGESGTIDPPSDCSSPGACAGNCTQWERDYQGKAGAADQFVAVAIAPDGTIVAAGMRDWVQDTGQGDLVVVGYDAAGDLLWELTPLGADNGVQDGALAVAVGPDGAIVVTGWILNPGPLRHGVFVLIGADRGMQQIFETAVGTEIDTAVFAADGTWIIGGAGDDGTGTGALTGFVHRYDAEGTFLREWVGDDIALPSGIVLGAVPISPTAFALTGSSDALGPSDVWLAALDVEGGLSWAVIHDGDPSTNQWGDDLALLPDGDLLLVGAEHDAEYNGLSWVGRFGPDGSTRWTRTYPGTGCCANPLDAVEVSDDGRIFVAGVRGDDGGDGLLIKVQELDCDGEIAWEWNHESPGWNIAFSGGLAWSSELGLVVSGSDHMSMTDQRGYVARLSL